MKQFIASEDIGRGDLVVISQDSTVKKSEIEATDFNHIKYGFIIKADDIEVNKIEH